MKMAFFNPMILAVSVLATKDAGASGRQFLSVALLASTMRSPMMGLVLALAIARNQTTSTPSSFSGASAGLLTTGSSSVGNLGIATSVSQIPDVGMPSFLNMTPFHAEKWAQALGFVLEFDVEESDLEGKFVVSQKPVVGGHIRKTRTVNLETGKAAI
jgi:hypothetical protein